MPTIPDCPCKIINSRSGYVLENMSWVVSRVMRDFDSWSNTATKKKQLEILETRWAELKSKDPPGQKTDKSRSYCNCLQAKNKQTCRHTGARYHLLERRLRDILAADYCHYSIRSFKRLVYSWYNSGGYNPCSCNRLFTQVEGGEMGVPNALNDVYALTKGTGSQHVIVIWPMGMGSISRTWQWDREIWIRPYSQLPELLFSAFLFSRYYS